MSFLLKNLELHITERHLLTGERLFEEGKVLDLIEPEKHLWTADVLGYEVEVQISPSKVLNSSCDCSGYSKTGFCEHISASLFSLRKRKTLNEEKKSQKRKRKSLPKRLTVSSVLEYAKPEDLAAFIRGFAKSNREFGLALKARFAAAVPMQNNYEKYAQLIDSTANTFRSKQDTINYKGASALIGISKELLGQAKDFIALENFYEAFVILEVLVKKITPLIPKIESKSEKLSAYPQSAFLHIERILNQNPAPELKTEIRLFCIEECSKPVYSEGKFSINFYRLLSHISSDSNEIRELLQLIDYELNKSNVTHYFKALLIIEKMQLFERMGAKNKVEKIVSKHSDNPQLILAAVRNCFENEDFERALKFGENGLLNISKKQERTELEKLLLKIYLNKKETQKIEQLSGNVFLNTFDFKYFNLCKKYSKVWEKKLENILSEIKSMPFSFQKRDVIAEIFLRESQPEKLFDYVQNADSIDLLKKYDRHLLPEKNSEVLELYFQILSKYLTNHFGLKSADKVMDVVFHLYEIGEDRLASKLKSKIKDAFPDRSVLIKTMVEG